MGVDTELGVPEYVFPELGSNDENLPSEDEIDFAFLEQVASTRSDILALQSQLAAAQAVMRSAKAERRPDATVAVSGGTTGAVYGDSAGDYLSSYVKNVPGANFTGALIFSMSLPNNSRSGAAEQAEANCKQAQIRLNQARQQLASQLKETVYKLNEYYKQVISANDALKMQKQLYENEKRRFAAGIITVDDMFNQDSKYLMAETKYYSIMTDYLQSVMDYKYFTGTMVEYIGE
jgi:outer membrane protein TolC